MSETWLSPHIVRQYAFCPQIPYMMLVLGKVEPVTDSMSIGKALAEEEKKEMINKIQPRNSKVLYNVPLKSEKYKMRGVADAIIMSPRGPSVVEFKAIKSKRLQKHHEYQLVAYTMMAEEQYGVAEESYLVYKNRYFKVKITEDKRKRVKDILMKVRKMIENEEPPPTQPSRKCRTCWYRKLCSETI